MTPGEKLRKMSKKALDRFSGQRGRGRPVKVVASSVRGRADNYRVWFERIWDEIEGPLLAAHTESEVVNAIRLAAPGNEEAVRVAPLVLKVLKDPNFPTRRGARIRFLADSIAGLGWVTLRSSRDICARERKADAKRHQILRYEYWIECSCGYEGHSVGHACPRCHAEIMFPID